MREEERRNKYRKRKVRSEGFFGGSKKKQRWEEKEGQLGERR